MINKSWRNRLFEIIEPQQQSLLSKAYDYFMLVLIITSIIPLATRSDVQWLNTLDKIAVSFFILDYIFRWITADLKLPNLPKWKAFIAYPFTAFAVIDLLSILPSFIALNRAFKLLRVARLLKILRVFKFLRYSKHMQILIRVLYKERQILFTVFLIAVGYILITALIMFNVEESAMFKDFFDALYWATTTLTTVGYGDIYPMSDIGRAISMISAILGVAVIALPSGVITASYLDELKNEKHDSCK